MEINLKHSDRFFIGGEWVQPTTDGTFGLIKPWTEERFYSVPEAMEADMQRAVAAAREAFDKGPWSRMSVSERGDYLRKLTAYLHSRAEEISTSWTDQMGVLKSYSTSLVPYCADLFTQTAELAENFGIVQHRETSSGAAVGLLAYEPVGVVAAVIPWNSPFSILTVKIAPALIAGCTVILKASPEAPLEAYILAEAVEAVGFPKGVVNVLTADRAVSEALISHPDVDKVSFTGSTAAGKRIASICGERIARFSLELGGKSAAVVLDDYEVSAVANAIAESTCIMSNQVCAALSRVVVSRSRHDDLVDAFAASFAKIRLGNPYEEGVQMGPLAMARQRDRVENYIAQGRAEGATLAQGGKRPADLNRGYFIEPTVFANVDNSSTIAREEIFGPVVAIIPADDEEQAIEIANDTLFGLNSAVFTNDVDRAYAVGRRLRAGTVGHNAFRADIGIGFGGFKQSGVGREGGEEGLRAFLEPKTMLMEGMPTRLD